MIFEKPKPRKLHVSNRNERKYHTDGPIGFVILAKFAKKVVSRNYVIRSKIRNEKLSRTDIFCNQVLKMSGQVF